MSRFEARSVSASYEGLADECARLSARDEEAREALASGGLYAREALSTLACTFVRRWLSREGVDTLDYDVIIAGAGPVGLFLACELRLAKLLGAGARTIGGPALTPQAASA